MIKTEADIKNIVFQTGLKHIAIIMDGNRRWAKEHNLPSMLGHKKGVEALKTVLKACHKFGVKYLTVYAFSTENWKRTPEEVDFLMNLLADTIKNEINELDESGVVVNFIGDLTKLGENLRRILSDATERTKNNTGVNLQIAFNYGGRDEIVNAVKNIVNSGLSADKITEELISENLYTKNIPSPDLLIRTGGEKRISNFLLWQSAYSEIYVTDEFWPEFGEESLAKGIEDFEKRQRRYGK
ncbi:isoprenyl transferase [bacterium]|nr:isoprenyl transferase [bacterium]